MSPHRRTIARRSAAAGAVSALSVPFLAGCFMLPSAPSGPAPVADIQQVKAATMLLVGQGTFIEQGTTAPAEAGWIGTGWFISPDGYAVTNNHVVTGAGTLSAHLGGPSGQELSAQIIGASECFDLAVIKVDVPAPVPFLAWFEGPITEGIEVYSAGFPAALAAEYTLTKGIVSQADSAVSTPWADVDHAIQHDARIRGGNSGGPLVGTDARVLGVNYAGDDVNDANIAIQRDSAQSTIEKLRNGETVLSLGVNARANAPSDTGAPQGIWVSSVKPGGAANLAGIEPGDVIDKLNGVSMGAGGTVAGYCDVLRTHGVDATLDVEVWRPSTGEILKGQVNGTPLAVTGTTGGSSNGGSAGGSGTTGQQTVGAFVTITSDGGTLELSVPDTWADVDGAPGADSEGRTWQFLKAAPSLDGYDNDFAVPGVFFVAIAPGAGGTTPQTLQADTHSWAKDACTVDEENGSFADGYATGAYNYYTDCGGIGADFVSLAARTDDGKADFLLEVQMPTAFDKSEALKEILRSYYIQF